MAVQAPFRMQITVAGMTCQHCVMSVSEQVAALPGVSTVDVCLDSGMVTVLADRALADSELAGAVSAAGFEITG